LTKEKISDIADGCELGDNEHEWMKLGAASMKPGHSVYKSAADTVALIEGSSALAKFFGTLGVRYDQDLDTAGSSGSTAPVIVKGKCPAFLTHSASAKRAGNWLMESGGTAGYLGVNEDSDAVNASGFINVAKLINDIASGDDVGIIDII